MKKDQVQVPIRIKDPEHKALKKAAKKTMRSLNSYILAAALDQARKDLRKTAD